MNLSAPSLNLQRVLQVTWGCTVTVVMQQQNQQAAKGPSINQEDMLTWHSRQRTRAWQGHPQAPSPGGPGSALGGLPANRDVEKLGRAATLPERIGASSKGNQQQADSHRAK